MLKKLNILYLLIFIGFCMLFLLPSNVYANDLIFEAKILTYYMGKDGQGGYQDPQNFLVWRNPTKKYFESSELSIWPVDENYGFTGTPIVRYDDKYLEGLANKDRFTASYESVNLTFHTEKGTNYKTDDEAPGFLVGFGVSKKPIKIDYPNNLNTDSVNITEIIDSELGYEKAKISSNYDAYKSSIVYKVKEPYTMASRTVHGPDETPGTSSYGEEKSNSRVALVDHGITENEYKDLLAAIEGKLEIKENQYYELLVSDSLHTKIDSPMFEKLNSDGGAEEITINGSQYFKNFETAFAMLANGFGNNTYTQPSYLNTRNYGVFDYYDTGDKRLPDEAYKFYSAVNYYDNWIRIPTHIVGNTISVSHVDINSVGTGNEVYLISDTNDFAVNIEKTETGGYIEKASSFGGTVTTANHLTTDQRSGTVQEVYSGYEPIQIRAIPSSFEIFTGDDNKKWARYVTAKNVKNSNGETHDYEIVGYKAEVLQDGTWVTVSSKNRADPEVQKNKIPVMAVDYTATNKSDFRIYFYYEEVAPVNEVYIDFYDSTTRTPLSDELRQKAIENYLKVEYNYNPSYTASRNDTKGLYCKIAWEVGKPFKFITSELSNVSSELRYVEYKEAEAETFEQASYAINADQEPTGDSSVEEITLPKDDVSKRIVSILIFYFDAGPDENKTARRLYVSHVKTTNSKLGIDELNNSYVIDELKGKENITIENKNKNLVSLPITKGFQSEYSFPVNLGISVEPADTADYTYVGMKVLTNTSYKDILKNFTTYGIKNLNEHNIGSSNVMDFTVIIFYYKEKGIPRELTNITTDARLDFINTEKPKYSGGTNQEYTSGNEYADNNERSINNLFSQEADYVPSNGELAPYVRTAPFIIQAINFGSKKQEEMKITSEECKLSVDYNVEVQTIGDDGNIVTEETTETLNDTVTREVTINYDKYQINNLHVLGIDNITFEDSNDNIGGKLFTDELGTLTPKAELYADSNIVTTPPEFKVKLNHTSLTDSANGKDEAQNKLNELKSQVKAESVEYTIYDDTFKIGNKEDILDMESNVHTGSVDVSGNSATIEVENSDTTDNYENTIAKYMNWSSESAYKEMTKYTDFDLTYYSISGGDDQFVKENGIRELKGKITYRNIYNYGGENYIPTYYFSEDEKCTPNDDNATITVNLNSKPTINLSNTDNPKVRKVNVYTPIEFGDWSDMVVTTTVFDSTIGQGVGKQMVVQANSTFTLTPKFDVQNINNNESHYNMDEEEIKKNVDYLYAVFNFKVKYGDTLYDAGDKIMLKYDPDATYTFMTTNDLESIETLKAKLLLIAVAKNATQGLRDYYAGLTFTPSSDSIRVKDPESFVGSVYNRLLTNVNNINQQGFLTRKDIKASSNHAIRTTGTSQTVPRIYDFAVTDCTDLAFKDVFRKSDNSNVNALSNTVYWSGTRYFPILDSAYRLDLGNSLNTNLNAVNSGKSRPDTENVNDPLYYYTMGSIPQRTIPLGPYKNTDTTYHFAPKLGYRISYDLKTTGNISEGAKREIHIIPRYYYISKDGKKFVDPNNIKLFFKASNGSYKELKTYKLSNTFNTNGEAPTIDGLYESSGSGSEYSIYYKPNDGYRQLRNNNYFTEGTGQINTDLSSSLVQLNISRMILTNKSMTTYGGYLQGWYGEFKLPNSTIAVEVVDNKYDINKPLTDGYIGVIFDIYCKDTESGGSSRVIAYSQNTRDDNNNVLPNASQWDYEGFLGFPQNNIGSTLRQPLSIQLEKDDAWTIDNDKYNTIKGTVILYDTDARAANDFN